MHVMSLEATRPPFHLDGSDNNNSPPGGWSSLIGIVTAICGNILISFALNTQRYAHMRLSRDREQWEEKHKARAQGKKRDRPRTYGTQQAEIAEQRARENAKSEPNGAANGHYDVEEPAGAQEGDPLIPHINAKGRMDGNEEGDEREVDEEEHKDKSYLRSPIWWLGIAMMIVGEAGNFLAYGFAPASIVSPLGVVALVSNCLIAPLLLGERFRWRDGVGVIIATAGCVTIVLSASDNNPKLTPDSIWHLITQWEFETYLGITVVLICILFVASDKFGDRTVLIDLGLVGLFGGYTALSTKGIASLLSNTIWHVVTFPITYLLLAILIFTAVMQIKYVNRALQHFNATVVIPTQFVLFTISVIAGSAILYRDFERESTEDAAKFVGGCALTFLGVWCITSGRQDDSEADVELGEQADAIDLLDEEHVLPEIRERNDDDADRRQSFIAGSSAGVLSLRRHHTTGTVPPSVLVTPSILPQSGHGATHLDLDLTPSPEDLMNVPPANATAVHPPPKPLIDSEESATASAQSNPPPLHATTSAPVIPQSTLTSLPRPHTPLKRNKSGPAADSSPNKDSPTPTPSSAAAAAAAGARRRSQGHLLLDPNNTNSHRLLSRHSVVGLIPGPLTSPLSASLTALVADSLRRGVDVPPTGSVRRRLSSKARPRTGGGGAGISSKRASTVALKRHSIASGDMEQYDADDSTETEEGAAAAQHLRAGTAGGQGSRLRSLSATWSEIFGNMGAVKRQGNGGGVQGEHGEETTR